MKIIVQKFGGTSVANQEQRQMVVEKIENCKKSGSFPVVVVSAIGRSGDPYATDTLINLSIDSGGKLESRELDLLMSCGEIISSVVLSNTIKSKGLESVVLTGGQAGIITNDMFGNARIVRVDTKNIVSYIEKGVIPVIAGFQGMTENGEITTLGRGGSDVTAAILGEALGAHVVEIYTDVEGVMAADPKLVPNAKVMDTIFYDEIFSMAENGAKVLHKRAVEIAMRSNIPLIVKNTMTNSSGTMVTGAKQLCEREAFYESKPVTAIAHTDGKSLVTLVYSPDSPWISDGEDLFRDLEENNIEISMVSILKCSKSFVIDNRQTERIYNIFDKKVVDYEMQKNCSIITLIGNGMKGTPGVIAKITKALSKNKIPILQTSDSHTTISCLIDSQHEKEAVNALYVEFGL